MRRRISALAVTAAIAGGVLFAVVPAQAATTTGQQTMAARAGGIHVNIDELRQQSAELKAKANRLENDGEYAAASRARAEANAIDRRIQQLIDAENNM
ncbi:hypothetical protein J7I98_11240 [Streptomyces sp. ISL-98]|uniref:hypothetical protein n=1 Tax=Streptomyces sp. ISL-98 TaxID=2819192 RepID=UPI001BE959D6|nr:hypothetical protein [Streptomyces sp. ISL-98]MBT2506461.1 hypothetical protein [Streptomyces sp. ISL-98]